MTVVLETLPAPTPAPGPDAKATKKGGWFVRITIVVVVLLWTIPTLGVLISSFRPEQLVDDTGWWTSLAHLFDGAQWTLENYRSALSGGGFGNAFLNSMAVAIPSTVIPVTVAAFAAYAFSWMDFRGRQWLFALLVGLQIVPLQMTLIPISQLYTRIGLGGTFLGVWLFHTGFGLPYAIYLMRNFLGSLPRELFESAYLDGASHWTAFYRLAIPLAVPAIASLGIFQFLWIWNDLLVALVFLGGNQPVLTYQISNMVTSLGSGWHVLTAAAFISMLLPMIVFFSLQRYFVRGLLAGSVKG